MYLKGEDTENNPNKETYGTVISTNTDFTKLMCKLLWLSYINKYSNGPYAVRCIGKKTFIESVPWDAVQFGISAWISAYLNNIANLSPTHKTDSIITCGPISSLEADGATYPRVMLDRSSSSRVATRWRRAERRREEGPPELLLHPGGLVCFWIWKRWKARMRCWRGRNKVAERREVKTEEDTWGETAKRKDRVSLNISSSMWYVQLSLRWAEF